MTTKALLTEGFLIRTQFQLLLGDVAESLEYFGAFKGTAGCTTQGVVGQTHELPIEDGILTQTADGNAHATLVVHVELDLRAVILGEVLDEVLRCVRQFQLWKPWTCSSPDGR